MNTLHDKKTLISSFHVTLKSFREKWNLLVSSECCRLIAADELQEKGSLYRATMWKDFHKKKETQNIRIHKRKRQMRISYSYSYSIIGHPKTPNRHPHPEKCFSSSSHKRKYLYIKIFINISTLRMCTIRRTQNYNEDVDTKEAFLAFWFWSDWSLRTFCPLPHRMLTSSFKTRQKHQLYARNYSSWKTQTCCRISQASSVDISLEMFTMNSISFKLLQCHVFML